MAENKKKKRKKTMTIGNVIAMMLMMLMGGACGFVIPHYLGRFFKNEGPIWQTLFMWVVAIVGMYVAIFLQTIIHEAGHLVAGLMSGYQFSSFRVGNLMVVKESGKNKIRKLSLAGTGGQCLMIPPEMTEGKIPFVLYNLGGSLMNLLATVVCVGFYFLCKNGSYLQLFFLMMCFAGVAFALVNGIPLRLGTVDNDGYNALQLGKSPEALRSLWVQLKVVEQTARGVRLKDMPDEWFYLPNDEGMKNSMIATMGIFYENRKMDEMAFEEVRCLIDRFLSMESAIIGIYRNMLICDRLYLELIGEKDSEKIEALYSKEQKKFMKQMRKFPSVIRVEYVYELLYKNDMQKAAQFKALFEKCAKTHPYASDIESERELMRIAEEI